MPSGCAFGALPCADFGTNGEVNLLEGMPTSKPGEYMQTSAPTVSNGLIIVGGLLYTIGAVVYARKSPDPSPTWFGYHEIFHACTILAFTAQYVAISIAEYT